MKEFLAQYGMFILEISVSLVGFLFLLFRKKVVIKDTAFKKLLEALPSIINNAEESLSSGQSRKAFVVASAISFLVDLTEEDPVKISKLYASKISKAVEDILSTPQSHKKE